jgi:hypothetical protein
MAIDPKDFSIHDEVLVEAEVDGEPLSLSSFVTNVLPEELWRRMCRIRGSTAFNPGSWST